jgi:hypothetical protein
MELTSLGSLKPVLEQLKPSFASTTATVITFTSFAQLPFSIARLMT